ncbi:hypothetical protein [Legionella santicrucis]|nr:hypothetical protein [Legionella santicrucis]
MKSSLFSANLRTNRTGSQERLNEVDTAISPINISIHSNTLQLVANWKFL